MSDDHDPDAAPQWDPKQAMASLAAERDIYDDTPETQAQKILVDATPAVAAGLVHLALHGEKETARLGASREVLNRVFGADKIGGGADDPIKAFVEGIVKEVQEGTINPIDKLGQ